MSEHEVRDAPEQGDEVEAHLLKEALAAGTAAAAVFAGTAQGAVEVAPGGAGLGKAQPSQIEVGPGGTQSAKEVGPGGTQSARAQKSEVGPGGTSAAAKKAKKKAAKAKRSARRR